MPTGDKSDTIRYDTDGDVDDGAYDDNDTDIENKQSESTKISLKKVLFLLFAFKCPSQQP